MQRNTAKSMLANGKVISVHRGWLPDHDPDRFKTTDYYYQNPDGRVRVTRFTPDGEELFDKQVMGNSGPASNIASVNEMRKKNDYLDWMDADESPVADRVEER
jgi:hypothetical protein